MSESIAMKNSNQNWAYVSTWGELRGLWGTPMTWMLNRWLNYSLGGGLWGTSMTRMQSWRLNYSLSGLWGTSMTRMLSWRLNYSLGGLWSTPMTRMLSRGLNYSLGAMISMPMRMLNSWLIIDKQNSNYHIRKSYSLLIINTYTSSIPKFFV